MIDFRYHLVSIIAVFIALAVGIVLGAGPLDQPIDSTVRQQAQAAKNSSEQLRTENDQLSTRLNHADSALSALRPAAVGQRLSGTTVALVALPSTSGSTLKDAREALQAAGATVSGSVSLTDDWVKPERGTDLQTVLSAHEQVGLTLPRSADALGERAATQLADALVTRDTTTVGKPDDEAEQLLKALRDESFLRLDNSPWTRSSLVVVLAATPDKPAATDDSAAVAEATRQRSELMQVPTQASRLSAGAVVAGQRGSAGTNGVVADVRTGSLRTSVSTVDDLDTPEGGIALALAVLAESADETGHYGEGAGADSALPDLPGITGS